MILFAIYEGYSLWCLMKSAIAIYTDMGMKVRLNIAANEKVK